MKIEQEGSFQHALTTAGINLFTGAGFSLLSKDKDHRPLPTGVGLRDELTQHFAVQGGEHLDLPQIVTVIEARDRSRLERFIRQRFTIGSYDERYQTLERLNIASVFTVNVDDLIHQIYASSSAHYINDMSQRGSSFGDRTAVDYVALHGCVRDRSRTFTFSSQELAATFARDPDRWFLLSARLQEHPSLFWGYSMADAGVLQTLHPQTRGARDTKPMWITLRESASDEATTSYFRAMGFNLIICDTDEMLDYIASLKIPAVTEIHENSTAAELFPDLAIPDPSSLPVRPLDVFLGGAQPVWTDVASNRIPRISHCRTLLDAIYRRQNALVIGVPGSGKSTILMQAALECDAQRLKLFAANLSREKAEMILARLSGRPCIVFIENFTDSAQAIDRLLESPSIQVVGADREYNFEIVSDIINPSRFEVIQSSELTAEDVQAVYDAIPEKHRLPRYVKPRAYHSREPSVFEVVQGNLTGPGLVERYKHALGDLEKANAWLVDLLLVTCYMQRARSFASTDLLLAYFRGVISPNDYKDLYDMVAILGRLLAFADGLAPDDLQDYFAPRSPLVAEIILEKVAKPAALERMLTRFWTEVSPYRIPNYRSVERHGFDWHFFRCAFPNADEGKRFYENIMQREKISYIRQHGALYLADHKRYREAFEWLDEALAEPTLLGRAGSWTIRNSHAIVLFKANIDAAETPDGTVETTLDRSMAMLEECHRSDRRKAYHAVTYAQQAMRYHDRYHNSRSTDYICTARQWLFEERRSSPWNRKVQFLLRDLERYA